MKILFFIESLRGSGKERRLAELLKGITKQTNFECELVLTCRDVHYSYVLDLGIKIHYLERKFLKKDPSIFVKFFKICNKFKPDIIHVWGNMVAIYAIPTKVILGIPMINSQITNVIYLWHTKFTFLFSDQIIANSMAGLRAYNAPHFKSIHIYNGFDFNRKVNIATPESVRQKFSIKTKYVIGMIASFVENKDYTSYLLAAMKILKERKDITFLCVGGRDDTPYRKLVSDEFIANIKFLGLQDNVESIINICDVGVLSTFTEGISNSIIEFMAFGKPVVATDGGGTKELIMDNVTGYLISCKSPEILGEKLTKLINDEDLRNSMGKKGNERIIKYFNLDKMVKAYIDNYKNIIIKSRR